MVQNGDTALTGCSFLFVRSFFPIFWFLSEDLCALCEVLIVQITYCKQINNLSQKRNAESSCCGSLRQQQRVARFFFYMMPKTLLFEILKFLASTRFFVDTNLALFSSRTIGVVCLYFVCGVDGSNYYVLSKYFFI